MHSVFIICLYLCMSNKQKQEKMKTVKFLDKVRSEIMGFNVYIVINHEGANVYSKKFFYDEKVQGKNEFNIFSAKCKPHKIYTDKKGSFFKVLGTDNKMVGKVYI